MRVDGVASCICVSLSGGGGGGRGGGFVPVKEEDGAIVGDEDYEEDEDEDEDDDNAPPATAAEKNDAVSWQGPSKKCSKRPAKRPSKRPFQPSFLELSATCLLMIERYLPGPTARVRAQHRRVAAEVGRCRLTLSTPR